MDPILILAGAAGLLTGLGVTEWVSHRRNLARIPLRIHVNGTRGKSGVTRLIAAGLREGGIRTVAKTTGTSPRLILPDGSEQAIHRLGRPNIIEQLRVVRSAVPYRPEALVLECMALQPALQSLSELKLVQATHGVITNARPDHLDIMGPTARDVALALAGTVPADGILFTAEEVHLDVFHSAAADRGTRLIAVAADEARGVSHGELNQFSYIEHAENVALALRVCHELGVDRQTALRGMWNTHPDDGVMTTHRLMNAGRQVDFVNAFAANDPESTRRNWDVALQRFPNPRRRIAVVNCRDDRPDRSRQLGEACVHWTADHYLLIGSGTEVFAKSATAAGLDPLQIVHGEGEAADDILEAIHRLGGHSALAVGIGNIGGPGIELVHRVREVSRSEAEIQRKAA